jgi:NodT family efflux transporter outer membrane factor (OMF) lipoprotein
MRLFALPCRWFSRALAVVAPVLVLGACVSVQVPKLPTGDLPAHWRNAPQLGAEPDLTGWWKHFHDPELNRLVGRALKGNLDLAQAVWKLRAARALEEASGADFKPQMAFSTTEHSNAANTASFFQAGFDATWELGLFGRSGASGHIAQADSGAAEAELQSARVSLVAEVVREYLQLRAAQRSEALLDTAAQAARRKVALLRVRERLQLASKLDVERSRAAAAKAESQLADPRAAIVQHAQALALLLGKSEPEPAWLKPGPLPELEASHMAPLPADLLRTQPEIHYAETQVLKAAGELGIAKASMYPRLELAGGLTFASRILGHDRLGDSHGIAGIGPVIDIPLFDWGRRRALRNARADLLQAALIGYRKAVLKGADQVEADLASLHASGQRVQYANTAVGAYERGLSLSKTLQGLGEADAMDLVDARLALSQSELGRVQARLEYGLAFVSLYKALGGAPLPKHVTAPADASAGAAHQGSGS